MKNVHKIQPQKQLLTTTFTPKSHFTSYLLLTQKLNMKLFFQKSPERTIPILQTRKRRVTRANIIPNTITGPILMTKTGKNKLIDNTQEKGIKKSIWTIKGGSTKGYQGKKVLLITPSNQNSTRLHLLTTLPTCILHLLPTCTLIKYLLTVYFHHHTPMEEYRWCLPWGCLHLFLSFTLTERSKKISYLQVPLRLMRLPQKDQKK